MGPRKESSPTYAGPPQVWRRREWMVTVGLALGLVALGGILFLTSQNREEDVLAEVRATATGLPVATQPKAPSASLARTDYSMTTVTPVVFESSEPTFTSTATAKSTTTPTPAASATPSPTPTDVPSPTQTPAPPTPSPTETETPTVTPTVTPTPTPTLSFSSPQLLSPENGQYFSGSETRIELRWLPVGVLEEDEWYGLIFRYRHQGYDIETGAWLKETSWVVPAYLAGQADEPDRRYDWGVVVVKEVERRPDGGRDGREISPRSEMRSFVWR